MLTSNWTIAKIRDYLTGETIDSAVVEQLHKDERKGVQRLLQQYSKRQEQVKAQQAHFEEMLGYEKKWRAKGMTYIAGVDEVGRGPLAGPVVAAAVILPADFQLLGLDDSKKLSKSKRESFAAYIKTHAVDYHIAMINAEIIDEINILNAAKKAMHQAITHLDKVEHALIDAVKLDHLPVTQEAIIKGDQKSVSIAAASVIAKVARDAYMHDLHQQFPAYGFDQNSGYGTRQHIEALQRDGKTPYHRKSFIHS
ncbi:ribonuclease HII [Gracilibacillus timonensis]|uniref:ribonuclease HII n=1 Tax=Gracilibacillus timonensis TaxID=1816696 RepID=UPI000A411541|nr:ribonuclease HII [Gracilibacillus timonensis]